jgi:hypothetical protein
MAIRARPRILNTEPTGCNCVEGDPSDRRRERTACIRGYATIALKGMAGMYMLR